MPKVSSWTMVISQMVLAVGSSAESNPVNFLELHMHYFIR